MTTPLTTAEIVERLTTDSDLLDAWATWELGALPVPGPMNHADIATNLRTAASALLALEGERDHEETFRRKLQTALMFWMPGVREATDTGLERSAGDDAYLLAGFEGAEPTTCWGDDILSRLEAAEAELAKVREERDAFFDKLRQLLCINSVLTALKAGAPLWLEHAEKLIDDHNAALAEKTV